MSASCELRWRAMEAIGDAIVIVDARQRVVDANRAAETLLGRAAGDLVGMAVGALLEPADGPPLARLAPSGGVWSGELRVRRPDGAQVRVDGTAHAFADGRGEATLCIVLPGAERRGLSHRPSQAPKLEAVGRLASGIAHEINTPAQYIGDNLRFLGSAFEHLAAQLPAPTDAQGELAYLLAEVPAAVAQSLDGIAQVSGIVRAVRQFAGSSVCDVALVDLNQEIETVLTLSRNEWKYVAVVEQDLDPGLPLVPCAAGQLQQVVLGLVVNAAEAIEAARGADPAAVGTITVRTRRDGDWAELRIQDTGIGMPDASRDRVFEPSFTTRDARRGLGHALSVAHEVVAVQHRGTLHCESVAGQGTTFVVRLPLARA